MWYRTFLRMLEHGQTDGLREKIDTLYANAKLSKAEYDDLILRLA